MTFAFLRTIFFLVLFSPLIIGCSSQKKEAEGTEKKKSLDFKGEFEGSSFRVAFLLKEESKQGHLKKKIHTLLQEIESSSSVNNDSSLIQKFNRKNLTTFEADEHLTRLFLTSKKAHEQSDGAFDPTVMPLVRFWGSESDKMAKVQSIDQAFIDSIQNRIGLNQVKLLTDDMKTVTDLSTVDPTTKNYLLDKQEADLQLDLSGIIKGYAVDKVAEVLLDNNIEDFYIGIGEKYRVNGKNMKGEDWSLPVHKPKEIRGHDKDLQTRIRLGSRSMATTGNYNEFYVKDGVKYAYTIDPMTGYPAENNLLSATVTASSCLEADAFATSFMVMGFKKSLNFLENHPDLQAYFIKSTPSGKLEVYHSKGMKEAMKQ